MIRILVPIVLAAWVYGLVVIRAVEMLDQIEAIRAETSRIREEAFPPLEP